MTSSDVDASLGAPASAAPVFGAGLVDGATVSAVDGPVLPLAACAAGVALLVGALSLLVGALSETDRWRRFLARLLRGSEVLGEPGVRGDEG